MKWLGLFVGVHILYSTPLFAQQSCSLYHNGSQNVEVHPSFQLIESEFNQSNEPVKFEELLTDSSAYLDYNNKKIYYSLNNGIHTPNTKWVPLSIRYSSLSQLKEDFTCEKLISIINKSKIFRQTSLVLQNYFFNKATSQDLGNAIINTESAYLNFKKGLTLNRIEALDRYQGILNKVKDIKERSSQERFFIDWKNVLSLIYSNEKEGIDYCRESTFLSDALLNGCTNCIGETSLFLSLFVDAGFEPPRGWELNVQLFKDHIRPVLFNSQSGFTFDLVYGQKEEKRASIVSWRSLILGLLEGFDNFVHPVEKKKIFRQGIDYSHRDLSCYFNRTWDLGYQTRDQVYNFNHFSSCGIFSDSEPSDQTIDTESRLSSNQEGVQGQERQSGSFLSFLSKGFSLNGDGDSLADVFKGIKENEEIFNSLNSKEMRMVSAFIEEKISSDEIIAQFQTKKLLEKLGIERGIIPKHDSFLSSLSETQLNSPVKPIIIQLSKDGEELIDFKYLQVKIVTNDENLYRRLLALDTIDRYVNFLQILSAKTRKNLEKLEKDFDTKNIIQAIKNQSQNPDYIAVGIASNIYAYFNTALIGLISLNNSATADLFELLVDFSFLPFYKTAFSKYSEYIDYINNTPLLFLKALDEANKSLKRENIKMRLHSPTLLNTDSGVFPASINLITGEQLSLDLDYSQILEYLFYNPDYFYTAEANEEEKKTLLVRPYFPLKINEVQSQEEQPLPLPKLDNPVVLEDVEPCRKNEVGIVWRPHGTGYIYCPPQEEHSQNAEEEQTPHEGFENGIDLEGSTLQEIPQGLDHIEPTKDTELQDGLNLSTFNHDDYINHLIDPRQEVILDYGLWRALMPFIHKKLTYSMKNRFALHHAQRASIQDLVSPEALESDAPLHLYDGLMESIKISYSNMIRYASFEISAEQLLRAAEHIALLEQEAAVPIFFKDFLFLKVAYYEGMQKTKMNWTLLGPQNNPNNIYFFDGLYVSPLKEGLSYEENLMQTLDPNLSVVTF